jgi:hypothetical protein
MPKTDDEYSAIAFVLIGVVCEAKVSLERPDSDIKTS